MDLLYLYPDKDDAPARVGKSIIEGLANCKNLLPFDEIKLILNTDKCRNSVYDFETMALSQIVNYPKEYVIHIPISPNIMPNKKFLLNIYSIIKKKPLIMHYHGDFRENIKIQFKYRSRLDYMAVPSAMFTPFILRNTSQVITHSYHLNRIVENRYGAKNSTVIPNGIDDFWFNPSKRLHSLEYSHIVNEDMFKIFFHGRLAPEKGVDLLINAFSQYLKKNSKAFLYIAGDGEHRRNLIKLCEKLKIKDKVVFLGNLNKDNIKLLLENVDLAIYPSRFDAFCIAVMEAFACSNCPVFFSQYAGIYDFVVKDGYQLKSFEPSIENIISILDCQCKNLDTDIISLQKEIASRYKWSSIIQKYTNLYCSLYM